MIQLGNWFPFPDPIERWFFSKDGHQWNHSEILTPKNMNMQRNEHTCTHDTRSNSQWRKYKNSAMQIYPITTRRNGTWYCILNNHEPRAHCMHCTHSLQLTTWTVPVYDVYVTIIMYIAHAWWITFQNFVSTVLVDVIGSITLYLSISSC